jgi:amino acid transporter
MKTEEGLIRAVGVRGLTAGIVNYTIGAGIFVLPAVVASRVGGAAPVIYLICAAAMGLIVLCFADAGSRVSLSGGTYAYAEVAFGPFVGFMVAMTLWFGSAVLACAAVANVTMDALATLIPALGTPAIRAVLIALMFGILAAVNIRGVKIGSGVVQTVTLAKLTPLLILAVVGLFAINAKNLTWPGMPSSGETARTAVILIFAFTGVESALTPSGEVKDPARTVPRSVFIALGLVTVLYIVLQVVAQGILGSELATNTKSPLAETALRAIGPAGKTLVLVGTAISTFGYVAGDMLASPRALYALGRDRLLPTAVGAVNPRFSTPHVAIIIHAAACAALAISGSFASLAVLAVLSCLLVYLVCCLATIQLRRKDIRSEGAIPFKVPGGPIVPILAVGVVVWLMSSSTRQEFLAIAAMLAIEVVLFLAMRGRRFVMAPAP